VFSGEGECVDGHVLMYNPSPSHMGGGGEGMHVHVLVFKTQSTTLLRGEGEKFPL
jgi:hypothetical protein